MYGDTGIDEMDIYVYSHSGLMHVRIVELKLLGTYGVCFMFIAWGEHHLSIYVPTYLPNLAIYIYIYRKLPLLLLLLLQHCPPVGAAAAAAVPASAA